MSVKTRERYTEFFIRREPKTRRATKREGAREKMVDREEHQRAQRDLSLVEHLTEYEEIVEKSERELEVMRGLIGRQAEMRNRTRAAERKLRRIIKMNARLKETTEAEEAKWRDLDQRTGEINAFTEKKI